MDAPVNDGTASVSTSAVRSSSQFVILLLVFLIVAVLRTNTGLFAYAHVPIGDESNRLGGAFAAFRAHKISRSIYDDSYIFVFKHISHDPIPAAFIIRGIASLLSVSGMFLLLASVRGVGMPGAFLTALLWNVNLINTPFVQKQTNTVFAFGLACLIIALRLRFPNRWVKILYIPAAMVAGFVRPEYHLLWILYIPYQISRLRWGESTKFQRGLSIAAATLVVAMALIAGAARPVREGLLSYFGYMDRYVFLGFSDCYATFYLAAHPEAAFDPMVEHQTLIAQVFHGAHGLSEAIRNNPTEVARFLARNCLSNLMSLPDLIEQHSILLPGASRGSGWLTEFLLTAEHWLVLAWIGFGMLWLGKKLLSKNGRAGARDSQPNDQRFMLLSLAAVSSVALLLLIPRARYWITLAPLLYCGSASLASHLASRLRGSTQAALGAAALLACSYPVFLSAGPDYARPLILALRSEVRNLLRARPLSSTRSATILGFYTRPLAAMTNPERLVPTGILSADGRESFSAQVTSLAPEFLVIDDPLRKSSLYNSEKDFFSAFTAKPDQFGYKEAIQAPHFNGTVIYEKLSAQ